MTHVILENCIKCKYTDCINVCPVECFHEGKNFLVINPDVCIDCGICIPECPIEAILSDNDIKNSNFLLLKLNLELSNKWPLITKSTSPFINNERWKTVKNKLHLLRL